MLVGRVAERERIDRALGLARAGSSSALVVRGEAGIGKSALLAYAVERAAGMRVLAARGSESESQIPFAALFDLVRPVLGQLDRIPEPQRAALAGALAIGPSTPADRFAIYAATLSLLAAASEDAPVLAVVDDLHWVDQASAEAITFAGRRLRAEGVVLLVAVRDGESEAPDTSGIPELRLGGLSRDEAVTLLREHAPSVTDETAELLYRATAGNPLALLEAPHLLTHGQLAGDEPLDAPLPVGERLELAFRRRLAELPPVVRSALLVAAAATTTSVAVVTRAAASLGAGTETFEAAERAALVALRGGVVEFRHPLVRSAVYQAASPGERRAAHRALAEALAREPGPHVSARRAWHLAESTVGPDAEVARELEEAAQRAVAQTGYAAAAAAFERAARLSPEAEEQARILRDAADAWQRAGRSRHALVLLDDALAIAPDGAVASSARHLRAVIEVSGGDVHAARARLVEEAGRIEAIEPERAARMLSDAVLASLVAADIDEAVRIATRAHAVATRASATTEVLAAVQLGKALILAGEARSGRSHVMRCTELLDDPDRLRHAFELAQCAPALMSIEEYALAERVLREATAAATSASALGLLAYALGAQAELDARLGRWTSAYAGAFESVHLAGAAGQQGQLSYNLARLARIEAAQGREDACRAHAERARALAQEVGADHAPPFAASALGLLELGLGRPDEAAAHLEETQRTIDRAGLREPGRLEWEEDLVEAYARAGRAADARRALDAFSERAAGAERAIAVAAAARCRGLLAASGFEEAFEDALAWHERSDTPFERARTELCYGERLRRSRDRKHAREHLWAALATFDRLGAGPWAERARGELRASGERVRRGAKADRDELTAQELQVALVVCEGASNKEAASRLFLSPKTIEFHLRNAYRKLDVRSRTELARVLADRERR